jgi:PhnB protein
MEEQLMAAVNVYLTFDGQCEEAFEQYRSIFGGEFASLSRFSEMPEDGSFSVDEAHRDRLMHVTLPISEETALMGSDTLPGAGPEIVTGNNFSISIAPDSREQADHFFEALS